MANTNVFFEVWVGDDQNVNITVLDSAGAPIDISSASAIDWRMAPSENEAVVLSKTLGSGVTITNGPQGVFQVSLSASDTASLAAGTYYQAARVTLSGAINHVAIGTVWLRPNPS